MLKVEYHLQDQQVLKEPKVDKDILVHKVLQDQQGQVVQQVAKELKELKELQVQLDLKDQQEHQEIEVRQGQEELQELKVHKVEVVQLVRQVLQDQQVQVVPQVLKVLQVLKGHKVRQDPQRRHVMVTIGIHQQLVPKLVIAQHIVNMSTNKFQVSTYMILNIYRYQTVKVVIATMVIVTLM